MTKKLMISIMMIIMPTHLLHPKADDNHHDASSASPAVMMISMTTHRLHLQWAERQFCNVCEKDEDDEEEGDDDETDEQTLAILPVVICWPQRL